MKLGNRKQVDSSLLTLSFTLVLVSPFAAAATAVADNEGDSIKSVTTAEASPPPPTSSARWSLPFSGAMKPVADPDAANIDPVTGVKHPFPVDSSYQVMKFGDDKGTPSVAPPQVFRTPTPATVISGQVSEWEGPITLDHIANHIVDTVYDKSPEGKRLDKQIKHLSGKSARATAVTKDAFEHTFQYQGFDPSSRAGKLILEDQYKIRNIAWAEYERQKFVDKIHGQVITSLMQLAEGIGMQDPSRGAPVIATAKGALESLVGQEETERTITGLTLWLNHVKVSEGAFQQAPWNTIERNKKLEDIVKTALVHDSVVNEVTRRVEKYAHPNQKLNTAVKVLGTGLNGIALLAPGLAIPLTASLAETSLKESTGGSEENKLEREFLLDKRIQSRFKVLSHEASMAVDNYRYALVTHNSPLLVMSDQVIANMTGQPTTIQLASSGTINPLPAMRDPKSSDPTSGVKLSAKKGKSLLDKLSL